MRRVQAFTFSLDDTALSVTVYLGLSSLVFAYFALLVRSSTSETLEAFSTPHHDMVSLCNAARIWTIDERTLVDGGLRPAPKMLASLARKELPEGLSGALGV
jgi:hypothetical protein